MAYGADKDRRGSEHDACPWVGARTLRGVSGAGSRLEVSVIIPVRNGARSLPELLEMVRLARIGYAVRVVGSAWAELVGAR
jgi:hypothetical protein